MQSVAGEEGKKKSYSPRWTGPSHPNFSLLCALYQFNLCCGHLRDPTAFSSHYKVFLA